MPGFRSRGKRFAKQILKSRFYYYSGIGDPGSIPGSKIPWRREQLPTPVSWPGEFHGLYSPGGHNESDMTELSRRKYSLEQRAKLFLFGTSNT